MGVRWALNSQVRRQRGQTMAEVAIVLPLLLLLLLGILQLGIVYNNYVTLTDAVRAGARQAVVGRGVADPVGSAVSRVRTSAVGLDQTRLSISVTSPWTQGSNVTVSASYPYSVNLLGLVVRSGSLTSVTTERVE
jgi:Flp pilus assembly protein TadG